MVIAFAALVDSTLRPAVAASAAFEVTDIFGRALNERGLTLVDWEGQIANPAIRFFVRAPTNAVFPANATLTANGARLYFDLPCTVGNNGPSKTISFANPSTIVPVALSIFPDRDTNDENYTLAIRLNATAAQTNLPIHVIDQDTAQTNLFNVTVNFSQDRTGLFNDLNKRAIVQQAAQDWAYFVGDMNLEVVAASAEQTFIWSPDGFINGRTVVNTAAYRGFLLYGYGIHSAELRSGGEASHAGGFQHSHNVALPIRRSGGYEAEAAGNFNSLGWFLTRSDDDWWVSGNLGHETNDLYSIAHHEIGHSLFFNPAHTLFSQFKAAGRIGTAAVVAYHGGPVRINPSDHFDGEIDRVSLRGAFGYEYYGSVPKKRWLITKLDLLNAQAIGYVLRPTSAFAALVLKTNAPLEGAVTIPYSHPLKASGGIPFYFFDVVSGALPLGLKLDSFTGTISGLPLTNGTFAFTLRVRDNTIESAGFSVPLRITVAPPPFQP